MAVPLYLNDHKERYMTEENTAVEDYKRNCEFHRLLRKYCGPNAYSIFTALQDRANDKDFDGWAFPSYETLMEDTGIGNRNAITTALEMLFDLGLIEWQLNGRHAIYKPVKKVNSTELILFRNRALSYQNDTKDSIKTIPSIVSKRYSNVYQLNVNQEKEESLDTNVSNGPFGPAPAPAQAIEQEDISHHKPKSTNQEIKQDVDLSSISPPPTSKSFFAYWRERYEAVQDKPRDRIAVLGELYGIVTGKKPIPGDYSQLGQLAKQQGSGYKVLQGILKMTSCDVMDDHMSYLRKVLDNDLRRGNERGRSERPDRPDRSGAKDSGKSITEQWNKSEADLREQFNRELLEYGLRPQF